LATFSKWRVGCGADFDEIIHPIQTQGAPRIDKKKYLDYFMVYDINWFTEIS